MEAEENKSSIESDVKLLIKLIEYDESQRKEWADNQVSFHSLRFNGISRTNIKPWQSDLAYMHSDAAIENIKPQYVGHIYNSELIADYTSRDEAIAPEMTLLRAQWFDNEIKNKSNFDREILSVVDIFLQSGNSYIRVFYNDNDQLEFEALRPLDVVVPKGTKNLQKATRVAVKKLLSPVEYALDKRMDVKDPDLIKKMIGDNSQEQKDIDDEKSDYKGFVEHTGKIEIWEVYVRDADGWILHTINKNLKDKPLRSPIRLQYTFQGIPFLPIINFPFEITDVGGIYDSRGLPEKLFADEAELTVLRNMQLDAVKVAGTPVFENPEGLQNIKNVEWGIMRVLPQGLTPKTMPFPNVNFQLAENNILTRSERRITSPDYSVRQMTDGSDRRTATEVNSINSLTMQSTNLRFKVLRISLSELYRYSDAILCYHRSSDEYVIVNGKRIDIPKDVMFGEFEIVPAGAEDLWNKERRTQQALQIFQLFNGQPWFDSVGFGKYVLTTLDPRFAGKFIIDNGLKQQNERVRQLEENLVMEHGDFVPIMPQDDDAVHALTANEALVKPLLTGRPLNQQAMQVITQHRNNHLESLKQKDSDTYKKVIEQMNQIKEAISEQMRQQQMQVQQQQPKLGNNLPQS